MLQKWEEEGKLKETDNEIVYLPGIGLKECRHRQTSCDDTPLTYTKEGEMGI